MSFNRYLIFSLVFILPRISAATDLDDIRDQLKKEVRNSPIGAGYAQLLNVFTGPDISASSFDADDVDYDIFKLPLQMELPLAKDGWQLVLRTTLSHARAEGEVPLFPPFQPVDSEWKADSGQVGAGLLIPLNGSWEAFAGAEFGISRLENEGKYRGILDQIILPEIADGISFNWDTNARISSLTGGLGYKRELAQKYSLDITGRYTFSHIASYSESSELPSFSEDVGTLSLKADLDHPIGISIADLPLFGTAHLGGTAFTGQNRDSLGFTHFYELGYSLGLDISQLGNRVKSLSLGYQWSKGADVDGHSVLFSWSLR